MNCPTCDAKVFMVMRELGQEKRIFAPCGHTDSPAEVKDVEERPDNPVVGGGEEG